MRGVCVVVPAYNEERLIANVIKGIPPSVEHIIVVNDASTDRTAETVTAVDEPRCVLINHERNTGVGGAVVSGYKKALELGAEIVVKLDGDGQMDVADFESVLEPLQDGRADYCKGVRFQDRQVLTEMPKVRLIGNLGLSFLVKAASGYWNVLDPTNGYTAIGRLPLERLELDKLSKGFFFEIDMLINLYRTGAVVEDVRMKARYGDETSHLSPLKALLIFPWPMFTAFCKRIVWQYFIQDFTACSAFLVSGSVLFLWGLFFGIYTWVSNYFAGELTPTGTIMLAAVPFMLGFQLLLQAAVLDIDNVPKHPQQRRPGSR